MYGVNSSILWMIFLLARFLLYFCLFSSFHRVNFVTFLCGRISLIIYTAFMCLTFFPFALLLPYFSYFCQFLYLIWLSVVCLVVSCLVELAIYKPRVFRVKWSGLRWTGFSGWIWNLFMCVGALFMGTDAHHAIISVALLITSCGFGIPILLHHHPLPQIPKKKTKQYSLYITRVCGFVFIQGIVVWNLSPVE